MIDPVQPDFENTPASQRRPSYGYAPQDVAAKPHVSIVTPFFNTGEVFKETWLSVLGQSFQQWEWLIVNDGSTDSAALELLDSFRMLDPRIQVIDHDKNRGLSAARNTGCRFASTPFLVILDSDDLLEPTAIEKWLWFLKSHPQCGFVKGHSVSFGSQQYLSSRSFDEGAAFLRDNLVNAMAMIRREVMEKAGGFDPEYRGGLEDWDFWLRAAHEGYWGGVVPEYLDWYRRRPSHGDRWSSWNDEGIQRFRRLVRQRYPRLVKKDGFPILREGDAPAFSRPGPLPSFQNLLTKRNPRTLFIVPWMEIGGADRVNLDWIAGLIAHGHEVTVCATLQATHRWAPKFSTLTPDVFVLPNFLPLTDVPFFLVYLIRSRQIDTVFIANSTLGYQLLPFLRSQCPDAAYLDINHAEEVHWLNGGHPRFGVGYQDLLDLNITSTTHLSNWMVDRGAVRERISVCYTGAAPELLALPSNDRTQIREKLKLAGDLFYIVFAGRLSAQKRPQLVVDILRRLKEHGLRFCCIFIGDGELRSAVKKGIDCHDLKDSVILTGAIDHEACLDYFSASDVFLLPSAYEGISVALYEAMATGLVPVVAKVGGHQEVLSDNEGFLIPHGSNEIDQYVEALTRLIAEPALLATMGQAARRRIAERFTTGNGVEALLSAISDAHRFSRTSPRQAPTPGFALETATLAIEYARLTTRTNASSRLSRLLRRVKRNKLGYFVVENWLTKRIVKAFGHTALMKQLRGR
jgi:glycosyltransferase involved in cell wall biosynthesis